ncbi:transposase [Corynebacterium glucuronolyticum]|uniref:Transposase n=2 Tax=Corynebacterium glucuronolyticum TaxID=39791 RepID=A0A7T4JW01_9CORY|nr:transposase [Corynebacterium glucuronolyticum]
MSLPASMEHARGYYAWITDLEFISSVLAEWAGEDATIQAFIPPGQPWHNGFVESLHNRMRDELFEQECFDGLPHARHCLQLWSNRYKTYHPHSALGFVSPQEYRKHYSPEAA